MSSAIGPWSSWASRCMQWAGGPSVLCSREYGWPTGFCGTSPRHHVVSSCRIDYMCHTNGDVLVAMPMYTAHMQVVRKSCWCNLKTAYACYKERTGRKLLCCKTPSPLPHHPSSSLSLSPWGCLQKTSRCCLLHMLPNAAVGRGLSHYNAHRGLDESRNLKALHTQG